MKLNLSHSKIFETCKEVVNNGVDINNMKYFRKQMLKAFISELLISTGYKAYGIRGIAKDIQSHICCNEQAFSIIFGFARDACFRDAIYRALEFNTFKEIEFVLRGYARFSCTPFFTLSDSNDEIKRSFCSYMIECLYYFKSNELELKYESYVKRGIRAVRRDLNIFERDKTYYCYSDSAFGYRVPDNKNNHMDKSIDLIGVYKVSRKNNNIIYNLYVLRQLNKTVYKEVLNKIKADYIKHIENGVDADVYVNSSYDYFKAIERECRNALMTSDEYEVEFKSNNWKYPECIYSFTFVER